MQHENDTLLTELIEIQSSQHLDFSLTVDGNTYKMNNVRISKKSTPVTKKVSRGGVYVSDKFVYQISATVFDTSLINSISDLMLGPNFEFKDIQIDMKNGFEKWNNLSLIVNLVNSVQKQRSNELTLNIIKLQQK